MLDRNTGWNKKLLTRRSMIGAIGSGVLIATHSSGARVLAQQGDAPTSFAEAPALAEQVRAGDLPPVEERLPRNPMVVQPTEQVGQFGGTWSTALVGGGDTAWLTRTVGYEYLMRWDPEWTQSIPNVAEAVEVSADAREYTFTLREGMKWSDGEPFTVDDILFYVNDIYRHPDLGSGLGDNPYTAERVDDLRVAIAFEEPNALFLDMLATPIVGPEWTRYPKHYLQQFHADYNTENLDQLIADNDADGWVNLFQMKGSGVPGTSADPMWSNPDLPTLHAWTIVEPYGGSAERVEAARNPYYWKVDPEGNQLPYIDNVQFAVLQDPEVLLLRVANGEIDMHDRHVASVANKPVLAENREKGGYEFFETVPSAMNTVTLGLNLSHPDEAMREIFLQKDFRIGLSHAINRQEIIDVVYASQGEPWQCAPRREMPFFNETLAKQYTEFDVDLANEHLDKVLPDMNDDGIRLRPNGDPITIILEASSAATDDVDATNLVVDYWRAVGIDAQLKAEDRSLLFSRRNSNQHDLVVWGGDAGLKDAILDPKWYLPTTNGAAYGVGWNAWWRGSDVAEPVEPPEACKRQIELYQELEATADEEARYNLFAEILKISQEEFWAIGVNLPAAGYGIVKNTMINVPELMPGGWFYPHPAPTNPVQYAFTDGASS